MSPPGPAPRLLSHSLALAAETDPDHPAVRCGDLELGYGDLVDRVARFAGALASVGVAPGDRVAVYCAKSLDAAVAVHGAEWAGCIAVPVDPAAPPDVAAAVLRHTGVGAVVTDARSAPRLAQAELDDPVLLGQGDVATPVHVTWDEIEAHDPVGPASRGADDPAYIISTSGSTGVPKGIVHTHASAMAYARLAASTYGLRCADRLLNVAPFHFDQSTFELYAGPVAGATTVLVPEVVLRFPAELAALVEREQATVWYSVPTILVQLLRRGALDRHDTSSLRWVLFGGEVFGAEALSELMTLLPGARFSNVYGPAEVNQCTYHHLDAPPQAGSSIPIGTAWPDTELLLVDEAGDPVLGPGRGLLEVRTTTMMQGYWDRPDLTERSIGWRAGVGGSPERWYRTGDICERDGAGLLHFVGRADRQVKVRGNRVELEAVEIAMCGIAGVARAAAFVRQDAHDALLVGMLEPDGSRDIDGEMRLVMNELRGSLPAHAVPTELVMVAALPRTSSGKVDTRAAAAMHTPERQEMPKMAGAGSSHPRRP